jgi:medium-chain acyl-[acyl-carrier-protein] hydrolase
MDSMTLDTWLPFRNEGSVVRCRVFCFPHAAGNATFYRPLRRFMPPEVDFCPVQLPGRTGRLPFGFFGHSVGACMAFEAARRLRSVDGRIAVHLFVSGRGSPKFASADPPQARPPSHRDLLAILRRFGGTPAAVMQRPEFIAALLPALRADLALVAGYAVDPQNRITCPITAFAGADDVAHSGSLQSWRDFTRGKFRTCILPGGHFYFSPAAAALAKEIIQDVYASVGTHAPGARSQL